MTLHVLSVYACVREKVVFVVLVEIVGAYTLHVHSEQYRSTLCNIKHLTGLQLSQISLPSCTFFAVMETGVTEIPLTLPVLTDQCVKHM